MVCGVEVSRRGFFIGNLESSKIKPPRIISLWRTPFLIRDGAPYSRAKHLFQLQ